MIQRQSILISPDNSGAQLLKCIQLLKNIKYNSASIGNKIVISIKKVISNKKVLRKQIYLCIIIKINKNLIRKDGTILKFSSNAGIIIKNNLPICTRLNSILPYELRRYGYNKLISLALLII
jgi:large subunit ribosomal protein L14